MGTRRGHSGSPGGVVQVAAATGVIAFLLLAHGVPTEGSGVLTEAEEQQLAGGALIAKTRQVGDFPWPEVTVYRWVAASPAEVLAVYADFDTQATFLPHVVESRIVDRVSPNSFRVAYEYEVTGPNERYVVLATVGRATDGLEVRWELLTARYMRRLMGRLLVRPGGKGALIQYTNRVDPGFLGSQFGSPETTVTQLLETVEALATHVERLRNEQPSRLGGLVATLNSLLEDG